MAAAAEERRTICASKLRDSMRQMRRYLDGDSFLERILIQKCEKIDGDREELISSHHLYIKKAGLNIDDEEVRTYIESKIDAAVDIVDEAYAKIEDLINDSLNESRVIDNELSIQKKNNEIITAKLEVKNNEALLDGLFTHMNLRIAKEEHTEKDVDELEVFLDEMKIVEEELNKSWNVVRSLLDTEEKLKELNDDISGVKMITMKVRTKAKVIIKKEDSVTHDEDSLISEGSNSRKIVHLQKMKPPTFSGDIREFARFKEDFESIVMSSYDQAVHQIYVLKETCLKGEAQSSVRNLKSLDDIWERLEDRFGASVDVVDAVLHEMENIVIPRFNQDQGVIKLIEALEKGVQDLTAINKKTEIANSYTVKLIEKKLPRRLMLLWLEEEEKGTHANRFDNLFEFLKKQRKMMERLVQQNKEENVKKKYPVGHLDVGGERKELVKNSCLLHPKSGHFTRKCKDFLSKTIDERVQVLKDLGACRFCLSNSHSGKPCSWIGKWNPCGVGDCKELHSRLVHGSSVLKTFPVNHFKKHEEKSVVSEAQTLLLMQDADASKGKKMAVFWDNGSSISLVTKRYARERKLKGIHVSYDLVTVGNVVNPQNTWLYDVPITDRDGNTTLIKAYKMDEIYHDVEIVNTKRISKLFRGLTSAEIERPRRRIDLLIGMNYAHLHPRIRETNGKLVLYDSLYGLGKVLGGQHELIVGKDNLSAFTKLVAHATFKNIAVDKKAMDFFSAENLGVNVPPRCNRCKNCRECTFETHQLSMIEQRELEVIRGNLKLDPVENVWRTMYPYKVDPSILSDNKNQALSLLVKLENRLKRSEEASRKYCEQFNEFICRGVFREIPEDELNDYNGPVSYISHHKVYKEDSTSTPIRIVLNSSLKYRGISLNDILMKGPNSLNDLFSVQLRFRTHKCALVTDVKKM